MTYTGHVKLNSCVYLAYVAAYRHAQKPDYLVIDVARWNPLLVLLSNYLPEHGLYNALR